MKITILKENLIKGLNIVEKITGKNLTLPILNNVLINTENNLLNLITTNLEIAIKYWVLAKIEKQGKITVPAKLLSQYISFLPDEKIDLELKNQILYIGSKNYKTQIKGLSDEEFPIIPKIETKDFIEINIFPFIEGISQVVNFTTLSQVRPELSGVYFNFRKNEAKIVATDSFRLAEKTLFFEKANPIDKEYSFILPQKTTQELINIFSSLEGKIKIYFTPSQIMFEYIAPESSQIKIQLISRLIDGEYPNYREIIPEKSKTKIILNKDMFINQIKTASLFGGKVNEIQIKAAPSKKVIEIFAQNPDLGENKSILPVKIEGREVKTSFNYRFLLDGLLNMKSSEVIFELNKFIPSKGESGKKTEAEAETEEGPAVLKPVGDESYIYVVMPMMSS